MAIYRYKIIEGVDENGWEWSAPSAEIEEVPCHYCGGEASKQQCPGDKGYHRHGCIHLPDDCGAGLAAVCDDCMPVAELEWARLRSR